MKKLRALDAVIAAFLCTVFSVILLCGSLDGLENRTLDWRFRARSQQELKTKIVLILITDECLTRLGTWPISRAIYASVIDRLASADAKAIAFDVVFEDNSTADPRGDEEFVASCHKYGKVILPLVLSEVQMFENPASPPILIEEARLPFQILADAAAGFGYINADFDYLNPDGVIQKTFLVHRFEDHWIPCYSLAIAEQVSGQQSTVTGQGINFCGQMLPLIDLPPYKPINNSWHAENGRAVYINYLGTKRQEPFSTFSFADIVENKYNPEDFRDAIVLVGPSAVGLGDLKLTPNGLKPGVVVHANLLENIMAMNFLTPLSMPVQIGILVAFSFFTFAILCWQGAFAISTLVFGVLFTGYALLCFIAFSAQRLVLPMTVPLLLTVIQYVVVRFVQLIVSLKLANANLIEQNIKLDQRVNELTVLHGAGLRFPAILETSILSKEILTRFCELRDADAGLLVYFESETGQFSPLGQVAGARGEAYIQEYRNELHEHLKTVFAGKTQMRVPGSLLFSIYLPLLVGDSCWGAICLHESETAKKSWQSEDFWTTLLGMCCTALENARLYEMAREVSLARQVQENFLPHKPLELNGYMVFGYSRPATQLGGDYFDYFVVENRYLIVLIADVMGHGVPAALGMTIVKTSVLQRDVEGFSMEKLAKTINDTLLNSQGKKLMVTAQFTVIDTLNHTSMIYHRGHVFPFRRPLGGKWSQQQCIIAPPLGVMKHATTPGTPVEILPGERWMFYTDGLYESLGEDEHCEQTDMKITDLQNYLDTRPLIPICEACADILDHHPSLLSGKPQPDDYTVLLLERSATA